MKHEANWQERTIRLLNEKHALLKDKHILIVGAGGVGGSALETLIRVGVGHITIVDCDVFAPSNLNRQILSTTQVLGKKKVEVAKERALSINPEIDFHTIEIFIKDGNVHEIFNQHYDFVIDAIDTVSPKVALLKYCYENKIPVIASMGSGGKMDPTKIEIKDINKTHHCKLALRIRKFLYKEGVKKGIPVVFSPEKNEEAKPEVVEGVKKSIIGTVPWMPTFFGQYCAYYCVKELLSFNES